jgi:hypothetical protein
MQTKKAYKELEIYRICSRNLRTFFSILAVEKSGCINYADLFCGGLDLDFILV